MAKSTQEELRRHIIGNYTDWLRPFDVADYVNNEPLIHKLHEEKQLALAHMDELEGKLKILSVAFNNLTLSYQSSKDALKESAKKGKAQFVLGLTAAILSSIGANIATGDKPYYWCGWILISVAVMLEALAFFVVSW